MSHKKTEIRHFEEVIDAFEVVRKVELSASRNIEIEDEGTLTVCSTISTGEKITMKVNHVTGDRVFKIDKREGSQ